MKIIQSTCLAAVLLGASLVLAETTPPSPRLKTLTTNMPAVGKVTDIKTLGIGVTPSNTPAPPPSQTAQSYNFVMPADLDRRATDAPPYSGRFKGLHLNIPLVVQPSYINYLFITDQPERILDTRERHWLKEEGGKTPPGQGALGIYARSPIPAKSTTRVLADHTNGTTRPLHFWLVWVPDADGYLKVKKRSQQVHKDSVAAGSRSFANMGELVVEPRVELKKGEGVPILDIPLKPEETAVVHMEYFSNVGGQLASVVTEEGEPFPGTVAALDATPILHSIVWKEEQERLGKFIDPSADPTRYKRILNAYQHARGHFQFPDRLAKVDYDVDSWAETDYPLQVYSLFESIPGTDVTAKNGASTDNRGKYGARNGLQVTLKKLPPGCQEMALLAFNRTGPYGGRHWVSDGKRKAFETFFRTGQGGQLLGKGQLTTLWRGPVTVGDTLTMWTEPMANTSVNMWYLLVPIPAE